MLRRKTARGTNGASAGGAEEARTDPRSGSRGVPVQAKQRGDRLVLPRLGAVTDSPASVDAKGLADTLAASREAIGIKTLPKNKLAAILWLHKHDSDIRRRSNTLSGKSF